MALIKVTTDELMRLSSEFREAANSIINNLSSINSLLTQLNHAWQGEASSAYMEKIKTEMQYSENLARTLLALSDDLWKVRQAYEAAESHLTSKIADIIN